MGNSEIQDLVMVFRSKFWDAFHRPNLKSEKYMLLWQSLEPINEWLVGPLFSIYEHGHCNYFFEDSNRFEGIHSPNDFLEWANGLVKDYKQGILAASEIEESDQEDIRLLHYQIDMKSELIQNAYQILIYLSI